MEMNEDQNKIPFRPADVPEQPAFSPEEASARLAAARDAIRDIDEGLARLIALRCCQYDDVWSAKQVLEKPVSDPVKEEEKLAAVRAASPDARTARSSAAALQTLMRISREEQYRMSLATGARWTPGDLIAHAPSAMPDYRVVVNQGTADSYSAIAAKSLFPEARTIQMRTFEGTAAQVRDDIVPAAVLPLENSTAGTVEEVYTIIERMGLYIIAAVDIPISHHLCVLPGATPADVKKVISHPQALAQCSLFIKTMGWETQRAQNTAFATRDVAARGDKTVAALASADAARNAGLEALDIQVSNELDNTTRFVTLSASPVILPDANVLSLIVRLPHRAGSLSGLLSLLNDYGLNLQKLQSRPIPDHPWEYKFYIDIEADRADPAPMEALHALVNEGYPVTFVGWYRRHQPAQGID